MRMRLWGHCWNSGWMLPWHVIKRKRWICEHISICWYSLLLNFLCCSASLQPERKSTQWSPRAAGQRIPYCLHWSVSNLCCWCVPQQCNTKTHLSSALGLNERLSDTRVNINFKELLLCPQIPIVMGKKIPFGVCFCSSLGFQEVAEKNTRTRQRDLWVYKDDLLLDLCRGYSSPSCSQCRWFRVCATVQVFYSRAFFLTQNINIAPEACVK